MATPAYPATQPYKPQTMAAVKPTNMADYQPFADAAYSQATSRLDPQFKQAEADFRQRMVGQGISEGNEAYDKAFANFNQGKNDAYGSARNQALAQALAAQGQSFDQQATQYGLETGDRQFGASMDFNQGRADMSDLMGLLGYGQSVTAQNNSTLNSDQQRAMGLLGLIPGMSPTPIDTQGASNSWLNQYNNQQNRNSADANARNAAYVQLASAFMGG